MSILFFKRNTDKRGEGRELYFTQISDIEKIIKSLLVYKPELKNKLWIDPCAADGRWQKVANNFNINCESYDIVPLNNSVKQLNFFDSNFDNNCFIIGNPPFSMAKKFIEKALSMTNMCYFLGGSGLLTGKLSNKVELLHRFEGYEGNQKDLRSKLFFIDTLGKQMGTFTAGALFSNNNNFSNFNRVPTKIQNSFCVGMKSFCIEDKRVFVIKK